MAISRLFRARVLLPLLTVLVGSGAFVLPSSTAGAAIVPCDTCVAWGWGDNDSGQLGDGTTTLASTPVQVSGLTDVAQVAAGAGHTLAVRRDGTVWAWGYNTNGQLGNGTTVSSLVPVQVSGLTNVTAIAAGYNDGFALRNDGTVWAWGANFHGQLGTGSFTNAPTTMPVQVNGLTGVTAIAADGSYSGGSTVAVRSDGTVWAWGYYTFGDHINVLSPIQVTGLVGITGIAISNGHSLALRGDGTVWAWGTNDFNQLGDGTLTTAPSPVKVNGLAGVASVSTGHAHSLALRSDGSAWAWGWGYTSGQSETGGIVIVSSNPLQVPDLPEVTAISAGEAHSLALDANGTVWAWGDNFYRELGNGTNVDSSTPIQVNGLSGITIVSAGYTDSLAARGGPIPTTTPTEPTPTPTPTPPSTGVHDIPGDSYTAGEGSFGYYPDSDDPATFNTCHRSPYAYGPLINMEAKLGRLKFFACSGAVTDDFYVANPSNPNEPSQLSQIDLDATNITFTISGNDAGFGHVVTKCTDGLRPPGTGEQDQGGYGCSKNKSLRADIDARLAALRGQPTDSIIVGRPIHPLVQLYKDMHTRAPKAHLYVGGYPRLFGASAANYERLKSAPGGQVCEVGSFAWNGLIPVRYRVDYLDAVWIDGLANRLNGTIQNAVTAAQEAGVPITFVPAAPFNGHGLCDRKASWIRGLDFVTSPKPGIASSSFHPNTTGQRYGYRPAFLSALG
jgi:alpha-tubulin suppressor-like RCC1 family protein